MSKFQLFDSIRLTDALPLDDGQIAPIGAPGAIVHGVRSQLLALMDELPDAKLETIRDFAEFLKSK
jgi:hypothetical protein